MSSPLHSRALELADELDAFAEGIPGWGSTASKLRQTASSLRWQVSWEVKHPTEEMHQSGRSET